MVNPRQRDVLISHIDGPVPRIVRDWYREHTTRALIHRGWLRYDRPLRPRSTIITEAGRMALAKALADWADALSKIDEQIAVLMDAARRTVEPRPPDRIRAPGQMAPKSEVE